MTRRRRAAVVTAALVLLSVTASSCSFFANEFLTLDTAGPVGSPSTPPSGVDVPR